MKKHEYKLPVARRRSQYAILTGGMEELEAQFLEWVDQNPEAYRALLQDFSAALREENHARLIRGIFTPAPGILRSGFTDENPATVSTHEPSTLTLETLEKSLHAMKEFKTDHEPVFKWQFAPRPSTADCCDIEIRHTYGLAAPSTWITPPAFLWYPAGDIAAEFEQLEAEILGEFRAHILNLLDFRITQKG